MRVLVIYDHYPVCSGRYITDAFKRAGHEVATTGRAMGRNIWGLTLPPELVHAPTWAWPHQYAMREQWDLVVLADSDPAVLGEARWYNDPEYAHLHTTRKVIVMGVDNHVRNYRVPGVDHYFLAHRHASLMAWEHPQLVPGGHSGMVVSYDMTHLPCAYDPIMCTPSSIPWQERAYDVAILGYMYPQRVAAVKALKAAGLKVLWGCGLVGESYAHAHHNARISLCLSARGDVAIRIFESAALGCVVMADYCKDFDILRPEGIWILDDPARLVNDVREILSQPEVARVSIERAQAWVQDHTWDARVKVVEAWYERQFVKV